MSKKKSLAWISAFIALALVAPVVWAATHMINGGFEENLNGWLGPAPWPVPQSATMSHITSPTFAGSLGAAQMINTSVGGSRLGRFGRCVDLPALPTPGVEHYIVWARIYVPADVTNFSRAYIRAQFFQDDNCGGNMGSVFTPDLFVVNLVPDEWNLIQQVIPFSQEITDTQTPPNTWLVSQAGSVAVYLHTHKTNDDPMTVFWDDALFADSTPSAISLGAIQVGQGGGNTAVPLFIALSLILALITLLWLRRLYLGTTFSNQI